MPVTIMDVFFNWSFLIHISIYLGLSKMLSDIPVYFLINKAEENVWQTYS